MLSVKPGGHMSNRGTNFANSWVVENVNAEVYDPGNAIIDKAISRMLDDAAKEGISAEEFEDVGDLHDFMAEAYESATDNEVERLASKDD
jgi:hypothetical protein